MAVRSSPFARLREADTITVSPREAAREALEQLQAERSEEKRAAQAARRPLLDWAKRVPEAKTGPLRFDDFPFQLELYGPEMTHDRDCGIRKCTQGGFSAWALRWALFHADVRGKTAMYVFPEDTHLRAFSNMRIKPVIRKSEYLRSRMEDEAVDNVTLKQVGLGWIAFRGAQTATGLMSVDADVLVIDEYDPSFDTGNLDEAEQRVTGPLSDGLIRRVGVPSTPGYGIDAVFVAGDQRAWTVKCQECDEWNRLEGSEGWQRNVDRERRLVVCRRCREPLDVRRGGEWVPRYPERSTRTYTIPKYAIYGVDLADMVERSKRTKPLQVQNFHRNDLGEPFTPKEGRLSLDAIRACVRGDFHVLEGLSSSRLVTMGVDVASVRALNVTISEHVDEYRKRKVFAGEIEDAPGRGTAFEQVARMMDLYGVNMAAVDHLPEGRLANALAARFPGRVYKVAFHTPKTERDQKQALDLPLNVDDEDRLATVSRLQSIDTTLDAFRRQWVMLPRLEEMPDEYAVQLGNLIRATEQDELGKVRVFYRSIGPVDFAMAEVYDVVATELWYRAVGIEAVQLQQQPTATRDAIDFTQPGEEDYRPGYGDRDEFGHGLDGIEGF